MCTGAAGLFAVSKCLKRDCRQLVDREDLMYKYGYVLVYIACDKLKSESEKQSTIILAATVAKQCMLKYENSK